jgi:hypothetical protein
MFMTFGLWNAVQTWQCFIDNVLRDLLFCFGYLDDILVFFRNENEHICAVFHCFSDYGIIINLKKCVLGAPKVIFLGYVVFSFGYYPTPDKVNAIQIFTQPFTVQQYWQFVGMLNFYWWHLQYGVAIQ